MSMVVLLSSVVAAAKPAPRVVLAGNEAGELFRKIRAEAAAIRLAVVVAPDDAAPADALLARHGARAVVRIHSKDRVSMTLQDAPDDFSTSTLRRAPGETEGFAVRVIEKVRAHFVELELLSEPERRRESGLAPDGTGRRVDEGETGGGAPRSREAESPEQPPSAAAGGGSPQAQDTETAQGPRRVSGEAGGPGPVAGGDAGGGAVVQGDAEGDAAQPAIPAGSRDRQALWLFAGGAGVAPSGGLGPSAHVAAGLRFEAAAPVSVAAKALPSVSEVAVRRVEGEAEGRPHLFDAQLGWMPLPRGRDWSLEVGPGLGLLLLVLQGEGRPPFDGHDDRLVAGTLYGHASAAYRLLPWLRMRATLSGGSTFPRPVIRFDGREIVSWGRLFGSAALVAELGVGLSEEGTP